MKPSIDPGSWVLQFAALLVEVWRDSDVRAQRRHRKAVEDLTAEAARKADAIARQAATTGSAVAPEGFGALLLDGNGEAIKVLMRVAVDPPSMPRDRRWWPDSVDARLAGLDGPTAAPALVWLDELPFLLLEELKSNLSKNPLSDLRLESRITEGFERLVATPRWPSVRDRRSEVEAYLRQVLPRATAAPPHGGWGVARVNQPVRVRSHDTRLRPQEDMGLADDRDPYDPKGAEALADREPPRPWSDVRDEWRHVSILGEPGYGKSWLLRDEAEAIAQASLRDLRTGTEPEEVTLPVLVRLDAVAEHLTREPGMDAAVVAAVGETYGLTPALQTWLIDRLASGSDSVVVLLDGLDEVDEGSRNPLIEGIGHWQPTCRVLLTSRVAGYPPTRINDRRTWGEVELTPFREEQVVGFMAQWFALQGTEASDVAKELLSKPWLAGMVRIPLLLSLVCLLLSDPAGARARPSRLEPQVLKNRLARLPRHRAGLYGQVVRRFLHAAHRDRAGLDDANVDRIISEAARIAWAFSNTSSGWAERLPAEQIKTTAEPFLDRDSTEAVLRRLRETGLLIADGFSDGLVAYRFLHRTFHEYLCAQQLANLPEQDRLAEVRRHLWFDPDWEQVILLLAGILDDPAPLLHELAGQDDDPFEHALALAVRAAAELLPLTTPSDVEVIFDQALTYLTAYESKVTDAMKSAAASGNDCVTADLTRLLTDSDPQVRGTAAAALKGTINPETRSAVITLLTDDDWSVRFTVMDVLRGTVNLDTLRVLAGLFSDDYHLRAMAHNLLRGTSDPDTMTALIHLLTDRDPAVRQWAAKALGGTGQPNALTALTRLLNDPHAGGRQAAAEALRGTSHPDALPALTRLLNDKNPGVREAAAEALRGTSHPDALPALTRLLNDTDLRVRQAAATALQGTSHPHTLTALIRLLNHGNPGARHAASTALHGTRHPDALTTLTRLLNDDNPDVRLAAADALQGTSHPHTLTALTRLLNDHEPGMRVAAATALHGTSHPDALTALIRLLNDDNPDVRSAAAAALGGGGHPDAASSLIRLLNDDNPDMRATAARALHGTSHPDALTALIRLLSDHRRVRSAATEALAALRSPRRCREVIDDLSSQQRHIEPELVLIVLRGIVSPAFRWAEDPDGLRRTVAAMIERARAAL